MYCSVSYRVWGLVAGMLPHASVCLSFHFCTIRLRCCTVDISTTQVPLTMPAARRRKQHLTPIFYFLFWHISIKTNRCLYYQSIPQSTSFFMIYQSTHFTNYRLIFLGTGDNSVSVLLGGTTFTSILCNVGVECFNIGVKVLPTLLVVQVAKWLVIFLDWGDVLGCICSLWCWIWFIRYLTH